ncbi:hypothetical protein [Kitasatospora viridis]|nr:hypothetical protein [Kitasatospora viridis]
MPGTIGLDGARAVLTAGGPVVVPHPWPLPFGLVGRDPRAVNEAKHRPAQQSVAFWAHRADTRADTGPALALGAAELKLLEELLTQEQLTVLVPVATHRQPPPCLAPATLDGWALLFGGRWQPLDALLDEFPVLYATSANLTGQPPVGTTEEALAAFGGATPVLHLADPPELAAEQRRPGRASTTTVRLHTGGRMTVHRLGIQDAAHPDPDAYLRHLAAQYGGTAG